MPAQTEDGTHIITKGELLDMLSRFDDYSRLRVQHARSEPPDDIVMWLEDRLEAIYGGNLANARDEVISELVEKMPNGGEWCINRCAMDDKGNLVIHLV